MTVIRVKNKCVMYHQIKVNTLISDQMKLSENVESFIIQKIQGVQKIWVTNYCYYGMKLGCPKY